MSNTTKKLVSYEDLDEDITVGMKVLHKNRECLITNVGYKYLKVNRIISQSLDAIEYDQFTYTADKEVIKYLIED